MNTGLFSPPMYTDFCLTILDDADQGDNGKQDDAPQGLLIHFVSRQWAEVQPWQQLSPVSAEGGSEGLSYLRS